MVAPNLQYGNESEIVVLLIKTVKEGKLKWELTDYMQHISSWQANKSQLIKTFPHFMKPKGSIKFLTVQRFKRTRHLFRILTQLNIFDAVIKVWNEKNSCLCKIIMLQVSATDWLRGHRHVPPRHGKNFIFFYKALNRPGDILFYGRFLWVL
jgi:hypothetical protein